MKLSQISFIVVLLICLSSTVLAEKVDHFEGEASPTLEIALTNLTNYNAKLEQLVLQETLTPEDFHQIHELTYTLENAMGRLAEEQARLSVILEEVHLASESGDTAIVKENGKAFVEGTKPLTQ